MVKNARITNKKVEAADGKEAALKHHLTRLRLIEPQGIVIHCLSLHSFAPSHTQKDNHGSYQQGSCKQNGGHKVRVADEKTHRVI